MAYTYQPIYTNPYGVMQRPDYSQPPMMAQTPPVQQAQPMQQGQVIRFVTSRQEAEVAQIPLDGSAVFFLDTANGKIYAKAFRADGTAPLTVYSREAETPPVQYVTQEQFDTLAKAFAKLKESVERTVDEGA